MTMPACHACDATSILRALNSPVWSNEVSSIIDFSPTAIKALRPVLKQVHVKASQGLSVPV